MEQVDYAVKMTRKELIQSVKDGYLRQGICLTLHKNSDHRRVIFKCYHGGTYTDKHDPAVPESKRRNTGTRLMDCPFQLKALYKKKDDSWTLYQMDENHNHPVTGNLGMVIMFLNLN